MRASKLILLLFFPILACDALLVELQQDGEEVGKSKQMDRSMEARTEARKEKPKATPRNRAKTNLKQKDAPKETRKEKPKGAPNRARKDESNEISTSAPRIPGFYQGRSGVCDKLTREYCAARAGCMWVMKKCEIRIAWLHVMKTASSLGTLLAHAANASLPVRAHVPNGLNKTDPEDVIVRPVDAANKHLVLDFFQYKYPISTWFQGVFRYPENPGGHIPIMDNEFDEWKGHWVAMFRQPEERVRSAFHHFAQGKGDILAFQQNVQGQHSSMMSLGRDALPRVACERSGGGQDGPSPSCNKLKDPNVQLAVERINGFAFVGIFEHFDLSICLFHAIFGTECLPVEFEVIRATHYHENETALAQELVELQKHADPWDTPLYEVARNRFRRDLAKYKVDNATCNKLCPGGPFTTESASQQGAI
eukprot:TRINITY_DN50619_c0_g1_i1.p1 TRINITY_DN50619_c0_g1~~TRINITY_DN50619_c0_g1_i1.p1  ORF type:complete len:422 (+),score=44.03 TRINITY_DN50619_c0_g1_i1:65-1330(+)